MKECFRIKEVRGREILDSRGNPTVEAEVVLANGSMGRAAVPSGASTGAYEAVELRDNKVRYNGNGVRTAVGHINTTIRSELLGMYAGSQREIDRALLESDGTDNKSGLGANAILGVSLANAKAMATALSIPFYQYVGGVNGITLPVPMMNVINGGKHADSSLNIQEFMIMPVGADSFGECLEWGTAVFMKLKSLLKKQGYVTAVGDEGGFAPKFENDEVALEFLTNAIKECGFVPRKDFYIAMDVAATELYDAAKEKGEEGKYYFWKSDIMKTRQEMIEYLSGLCMKYPIKSIEDPLGEEDWEGFRILTKEIGDRVQIVGDDLFVTNTKKIQKGIEEQAANAVLIKPNQIGTLSETIDAVEMTKNIGWKAILSHRSGETEDTTIADLAVALNCRQIKTGAPSRTDRVAKYNQLLRIEESLGESARFPGVHCMRV
ncbi:phosphopyruvate hydratase [Anaerolentibacter hominis]|uniref:phosphopyruvate hydratase n=1 Tax=Anaerolentibacter hominis TaxID=3079009 RepID=UPI0031B7FE59